MSLRSRFAAFLSGSPKSSGAICYTTSSCARFDHPEFQIQVSRNAIPEEDISWFLQFLEQRVADGERFHVGESLQIGWMFTMIQDSPTGFLRIVEPDMKSVPINFVDCVDNTLKHLRAQRDVAASLTPEIQAAFPSLRQSAVVHINYKAAEHVLLSRLESNEMDSGWWFTDADDQNGSQDPTRFIKTSLYQLGIDRPDLIKFFALPAGLQVIIHKARIGVLDSNGEVSQIPGSFLSELNRLRQLHEEYHL